MVENPYRSPKSMEWPRRGGGIRGMFAAILGRPIRRSVARCSFCGAPWDKSRPFAEGAGPRGVGGVFICRECVRACEQLLDDELRRLNP